MTYFTWTMLIILGLSILASLVFFCVAVMELRKHNPPKVRAARNRLIICALIAAVSSAIFTLLTGPGILENMTLALVYRVGPFIFGIIIAGFMFTKAAKYEEEHDSSENK